MPTSSAFRIRFAIVSIFSALAVGFLLSPGNAQPGRPPGTGISGRPPGGISGVPGGGITGVPGGVTGMPSRPPTFPTPPVPPAGIGGNPGGISGIPGGGLPGGGISGPSVYEWTCGKCKRSLGTTTTPFSPHTKCPYCGVTFTGTTITSGGIGGGPPLTTPGPPPGFGLPGGTTSGGGAPGGSAPPSTPPRNDNEPPPLPTNPGAGGGGITMLATPDDTQPEPTNPAPSVSPNDNSATSDKPAETKSSGTRTIVIIGIVIGLLLVAGAVTALGFVVMKANQPVRRTPRRRALDLDDD